MPCLLARLKRVSETHIAALSNIWNTELHRDNDDDRRDDNKRFEAKELS
jgi:hypothetical protein